MSLRVEVQSAVDLIADTAQEEEGLWYSDRRLHHPLQEEIDDVPTRRRVLDEDVAHVDADELLDLLHFRLHLEGPSLAVEEVGE